jgi:spermidine/putrescine transport system substrate-binding protein
MKTKSLLSKLSGASFAALLLVTALPSTQAVAGDLNALVWCDHSDPNLLKPFEDANGIKVNVKEFEGTGAGLALVDQSKPGDWDVMVIDSIYSSLCQKINCLWPICFPK